MSTAPALRSAGRTLSNLPPVAHRRLRWFELYVRFYLRRNFHRLHLLQLTPFEQQIQDYPLLICLNHPSWWDPLIAVHLSQRYFALRRQYAPIASKGLAKYRFFERLGFFGIDPSTRAGAARFLRLGQAVLKRSDGVFWVTPQGKFSDVRSRPVIIESGVGHLAHRLGRFAMLPLALDYTFWDERFPEAFACFGQPVLAETGGDRSADEWTALFSQALTITQDALAQKVQQRDHTLFEPLIKGGAGVGGVYDLWRACKARLRGKPWQPEHGSF